jgi:glycine cleavage system H protein
MVAILVLLTIITFLTLDYVVQRRSARAALGAAEPAAAVPLSGLALELATPPAGLFCAPGHTWLQLERDGTVRIGAGALPVAALGAVDAVELPSPGTALAPGDAVATLRRGGRTIHLRSPIEGTIEAVNERLGADPSCVAATPFDGGWICRIRPRQLAATLRSFVVADEARAWLAAELARFREFVAGLSAHQRVAVPTLADGGEPVRGLALVVDDAAWHELVATFFEGPAPHGAAH